jgi:hypothetical protein
MLLELSILLLELSIMLLVLSIMLLELSIMLLELSIIFLELLSVMFLELSILLPELLSIMLLERRSKLWHHLGSSFMIVNMLIVAFLQSESTTMNFFQEVFGCSNDRQFEKFFRLK